MKINNKPIRIKISFKLTENSPQHPLGYTYFEEDGVSYYVSPEGDLIFPEDDGYITVEIESKMISDITVKYLNQLTKPGDLIKLSEVGFCSYFGTNSGIISEPMLGIVIKNGIWTDFTRPDKTETSNFESAFFIFNATRTDCKEVEMIIKSQN